MKICPACREPLHTALDEITHEEMHAHRGMVRAVKKGGTKGKPTPEIVDPGVSVAVINHATAPDIVTEHKKHCPTCTCKRIHASNAARQRAYRERKAKRGVVQ